MGFLDNFKIETWYKLILYIGIFGLFGVFFIPVQGFNNLSVLFIFLGCVLIGLGEWKRERIVQYIKPPNVYTGPAGLITQKIQSNDSLGIILEIIGCLLIIFGLLKIML